MPWTAVDDRATEIGLPIDTSQLAPIGHRQLEAPAGATWPRACIRPYQDGWVAKVWLAPGIPARRKGLLLAGWHSVRTDALAYAVQQVGILRMFPGKGRSYPDPKGEPPC